jgi:hypothetical protein
VSTIRFTVKLSRNIHKGEEQVISIVHNISAWYPLSHTRDKKIYWVIGGCRRLAGCRREVVAGGQLVA